MDDGGRGDGNDGDNAAAADNDGGAGSCGHYDDHSNRALKIDNNNNYDRL